MLLHEADRIEDLKSKDHTSEGTSQHLNIMTESTLDIMTDATAVITVGGTHINLGTIQSVNSNTVRMFSHSRVQLERRNLFELIAAPMGGFFDGMLRHYLRTGEGRIDSNFICFGLNKSPMLVPMLFCMREAPADDGPPTFIALLRELRSPDSHVLLNSALCITGASPLACEMLRLDANALTSHAEFHISDFVKDVSATRLVRAARRAARM